MLREGKQSAVYLALAQKQKTDTLLYACLKSLRTSKCNKVKSKYVILIMNVPLRFKQYQAPDTLKGIFPPSLLACNQQVIVSPEIPPESRDRYFLINVSNDSNTTQDVMTAHTSICLLLYTSLSLDCCRSKEPSVNSLPTKYLTNGSRTSWKWLLSCKNHTFFR